MPEIIIKINDSPTEPGGKRFKNEDIVHAHNDEYLLWQNTQRIVDPRKLPGGFFKPVDSMAFATGEAVSQYKYERISVTQIVRTLLSDSSSEILSDTPNAKGERIDVPLFMERRIAGGKLAMFRDEPTAIWFGGRTNASLTVQDQLWTDVITPETGLNEEDFKQKTNYRVSVLKAYFIIVTDDFDNNRRGQLESPQMILPPQAQVPEFVAKRSNFIQWSNLSGLSASDKVAIADPTVAVPVDRNVRALDAIVKTKGPPP